MQRYKSQRQHQRRPIGKRIDRCVSATVTEEGGMLDRQSMRRPARNRDMEEWWRIKNPGMCST